MTSRMTTRPRPAKAAESVGKPAPSVAPAKRAPRASPAVQRLADLQRLAAGGVQAAAMGDVQRRADSSAPAQRARVLQRRSAERAPLQFVTYDQAEATLRTTEEKTALRGWVKATTRSNKKRRWDQMLAMYSHAEVIAKVSHARDQIGIATPAPTRPDAAAVRTMTLQEFNTHATEQADWHANPALPKKPIRDHLRELLFFARTNNGAALPACDEMRIHDLLVALKKHGDEALRSLRKYADIVRRGEPINLKKTTNVKAAIDWGKNAEMLIPAFGDNILKGAMTEDAFVTMVDFDLVDGVIDYYQSVKPTPIFQANNGRDFYSYAQISHNDGKKPKDYKSTIIADKIRNYHRFTKTALDRLVINYGDKSKAKPLTLIVHSSLDHNGAFHRDPNLDAVITNNNMLTLMIEGATTLAEVQGDIGPLAQAYGRRGKIDQVMLAGHGGAQLIEVAGELRGGGQLNRRGELEEVNEDIDLRGRSKRRAARALFDELLRNMDEDPAMLEKTGKSLGSTKLPPTEPHRRILFNACLTASNDIGVALDPKNKAEARRQIRGWLANNQNLVSFLIGRAAAMSRSEVTVRGSVASHGRLNMLADDDSLDLISADDPKLTASKIEYVKHGTEPMGVMRAVLECWSVAEEKDRALLVSRMMARVANKSPEWNLAVIERCMYVAMRHYWDNGKALRYLTFIAGELSHAKSESSCKVAHFANTRQTNFVGAFVLRDLSRATAWTDVPRIALVVHQVRMLLGKDGAGPGEAFINQLGAHFDCRRARRFVDLAELRPLIGTLLGGAGSAKGKLVLALLSYVKDRNATAKAHLEHVLDARPAPNHTSFDPTLRVGALLNGISTEDEVLIRLGRKPDPFANAAPAPADPTGNLAPRGEELNTMRLQSVNWEATISKAGGASLYTKPDAASKVTRLKRNATVKIIAHNELWFAVAYSYGAGLVGSGTPGTAFVLRDQVTVTRR